jgi:C4-dicarboxylate-specific signal transduction histidine kinase
MQQGLLNLMRNTIEALQTTSRRDLFVETRPEGYNMLLSV